MPLKSCYNTKCHQSQCKDNIYGIPIHSNVFVSLGDLVKSDDINVYSSIETLNGMDGNRICFDKKSYLAPKVRRDCNHVVTDKTAFNDSKGRADASVSHHVNVPTDVNLDTHKKGLKVCHLNAQSLIPCLDELKLWLKFNSYHVITLSETWLDSSVDDTEINIPGFVIERKDRNRHGGGVAIYIKDDIKYVRRYEVEKENNESIWVEIQQIHQKPIVIGSLYRPQTEGVDYFDVLSEIVDGVINENKEVVLLGDLNCDFLKTNSFTNHMKCFMEMYNFMQIVNKATRITPTSKTLVDVILTTNSNICVDTSVIHHSFSDHGLIQTVILSKPKSSSSVINKGVTKKFRSFKDFNVDVFNDDLNKVDWAIDDSVSVNAAWNKFVDKFTKVCDAHVPMKTIRFKSDLCPWLENRNDIFDVMHERDFQHKKAINNNVDNNEHWSKYKELRNKVNKMMRDAKREYYTDKIEESAGDTKNMWKTLKQLLPNKKGNITTLPTTCGNDTSLANKFNKHFTSIGSESCKEKFTSDIADNTVVNNQFKFSCITVDEIIDELNAIPQNKASGIDNISTKLLKYAAKSIAPVLCKIFNMCLKQGIVPDDLKSARVIPLFKSGDQDELSNYRPISILPVCSKIIEKIVHKQLYKYVTDKNILHDGQSGFRHQHSTCTALIKTIDKWNV